MKIIFEIQTLSKKSDIKLNTLYFIILFYRMFGF